MENLKIATRKSKLALVQTEWVMEEVKKRFNKDTEKLLVETEGDMRLDVSLDKIGGKGLFVKDIEIVLMEGRADAAVHSMKDVPYAIEDIFEIVAMPIREDVRDAFISRDGTEFADLPYGARVGTSSLRRAMQLKLMRPDIETVPIRGNVQTRISKIEKENLQGIILASAGLKRLGMENVITNYFEPWELVPAVGQGALGIEVVKTSKNREVFKALDNPQVRICVEAERSFMKTLQGGCHACIGAYATVEAGVMQISGIFQVGDKLVKESLCGPAEKHIELGEELGRKILGK